MLCVMLCPAAIVTTHRPGVQPVLHATPHPPQLPALVCRSTHVPPHPVCPPGQQTPLETMLPIGQRQAPPTQAGCGCAQTTRLPHVGPQLPLALRVVSQPSFTPPQAP